MAGKARRARGRVHQTCGPVSASDSDPTSSAEPIVKKLCLNLPPEPPEQSSSISDSTSQDNSSDTDPAPPQASLLKPTALDANSNAVVSPMAPKTAAGGEEAICSITLRNEQIPPTPSPNPSRADSPPEASGSNVVFTFYTNIDILAKVARNA